MNLPRELFDSIGQKAWDLDITWSVWVQETSDGLPTALVLTGLAEKELVESLKSRVEEVTLAEDAPTSTVAEPSERCESYEHEQIDGDEDLDELSKLYEKVLAFCKEKEFPTLFEMRVSAPVPMFARFLFVVQGPLVERVIPLLEEFEQDWPIEQVN